MTRLGRELPGVRVGADTRRLEPARSRDDEAAGEHLGIGILVERVALPGEQRLVDLQTVGGVHHAVAGNLIAGPELEQIVEHHRIHRNLGRGPVAHHPGSGRVEDRESVERALGTHLLEDADAGVGHQHEPEDRVLNRTDDQRSRRARRRGWR